MEIPAEKVSEELTNVLNELRRSIKIDGFRPGKIPTSVLFMRFGKEIRNQVAETLIENSLHKVIADNGLELAGQPEFGEIKIAEHEPFVYEVTFEVVPQIDVSGYRGVKVERSRVEVGDRDIAESLERVRQSQATWEVVSDRAAGENDQVFGKLTLSENGKPVPGWINRNMTVTIGENTVFPDSEFERKLIGATSGAAHEYEIQFPPDYDYYRDFAGKLIRANWQISEIKMKRIPEIDNDLAKDLGLDTLEELKKQLSDDMIKQRTQQAQEEVPVKIIDTLLNDNPFDVTDYMVDKELSGMLTNSRFGDQSQNEELKKMLRPIAERNVKQRILMDRIAVLEHIEVSTEEIEKEFQKANSESDMPESELRKKWFEDGLFDLARREIMRWKANDLVVENAVVTEVDSSGPITESKRKKKEENDE